MSYIRSINNLNVLLLLLAIPLCSVTANESKKEWQAPYFQDHVLVGNIWDTHKQAWLTEKQFYKELVHYDYILLGEVHNHPDHHILQSNVINSLVTFGLRPSVVLEMLEIQSWKDQPQIWAKAQELQELASMLNDGWPWELYRPILNSIVRHRLKLYAGNISSEELQIWANDQPTFDKNIAEKNYSYTEENFETLKKDIIESHCGHANEGLVQFMSRAQMQRDFVMVNALIDKQRPLVFIAGNGHVRTDYAVPMQLRRKYNQTSYLSVAYIPVQNEMQDPQEYLRDSFNLYDIVYFTPSHTNEDPCEKFKEQLKNMNHPQTP